MLGAPKDTPRPSSPGLAVIEELSGGNSGVEAPFLAAIEGMGGHQLYPHQAAVIDQAAELAARRA